MGISQLYLRSLYAVYNIVTTTGSGDVYACTDLERCFFIGMITLGDMIFSLSFGFIASFTMMQTVASESSNFVEKIIMTDRYMDEHGMKLKQKLRVEEYFYYKKGYESLLTAFDRENLYSKLP